tara:strand:- start:193 stop:1566 length:1374 start_codon:yes stop_codon:yes gene_type:complete
MPKNLSESIQEMLKLLGNFIEESKKYKEAGESKINALSVSVSQLMPLFISIIIVYIIYLNNMPVDFETLPNIWPFEYWGGIRFSSIMNIIVILFTLGIVIACQDNIKRFYISMITLFFVIIIIYTTIYIIYKNKDEEYLKSINATLYDGANFWIITFLSTLLICGLIGIIFYNHTFEKLLTYQIIILLFFVILFLFFRIDGLLDIVMDIILDPLKDTFNALIHGEESERFPRIESGGDRILILFFLFLRLIITIFIVDDLVFLGKNEKHKGEDGYSTARWIVFVLLVIVGLILTLYSFEYPVKRIKTITFSERCGNITSVYECNNESGCESSDLNNNDDNVTCTAKEEFADNIIDTKLEITNGSWWEKLYTSIIYDKFLVIGFIILFYFKFYKNKNKNKNKDPVSVVEENTKKKVIEYIINNYCNKIPEGFCKNPSIISSEYWKSHLRFGSRKSSPK